LIDPRAVIDALARLDEGVSVSPYAIIGPEVEIGAGTWIGPHAVISGPTRIGRDNKIFQFASIGDAPQDMKYQGEPTLLEIGDRNVIREYVTINRGTVQDRGVTSIGNDNWIMAYVHIAHDCDIGSHTIFANAASLAGHVCVHDYAILGGFTLVSQFCRIGAHGFCAMGSVINRNVPHYIVVSGHMAEPRGINVEGLRRREFSAQAISQLRQAYKILYKSNLRLEHATEQLRVMAAQQPEIALLVDFLENQKRPIVR
jgi:UDP-N-acetylglucosamine acyltransferase